MILRLLLLISLLPVAGLTAQPDSLFLHCGTVIDGLGNSATARTIVVADGRITAVRAGYADPPPGAAAVDLRAATVLPGFIDLHVHLENQSSPRSYLERFTLDPADVALRATVYCRRTLEAGFTTVRDLGGTGVNVSLRNAIAAGHVTGPRIFTAEKAIGTTGGHADPSNGRNQELTFDAGPAAGVINTPDEAWKAVRTRYKNGADCIKITATGGVLSVAKDGQGPQFRDEEVSAIVAAAREYGLHTAAHAHGNEGMRRAIRAGITTIEHGTLMDAETAALMKEYGTVLVPTLSAGAFVAGKAKIPGYFPAIIVPKALAIGSRQKAIFAANYERGVAVAFGTDAGVSPHGENAREFALMVDCGMPPMAAIVAATSTAARVLGQEDRLGQLRPDFVADVVAVKGDPLKDISVLEKVAFVMKEGVIVKND